MSLNSIVDLTEAYNPSVGRKEVLNSSVGRKAVLNSNSGCKAVSNSSSCCPVERFRFLVPVVKRFRIPVSVVKRHVHVTVNKVKITHFASFTFWKSPRMKRHIFSHNKNGVRKKVSLRLSDTRAPKLPCQEKRHLLHTPF